MAALAPGPSPSLQQHGLHTWLCQHEIVAGPAIVCGPASPCARLQLSWTSSTGGGRRLRPAPRRTRSSRCGSRGTPLVVCASIGFTADPRVGVERSASALLRDASSLLLYQDVLKASPAQAFLRVLVALRRGDDPTKTLEAYGEFFHQMAQNGHSSWEDYVLDRILAGQDNPFATGAAAAGSPPVPRSLQLAAQADLDALQRLSITETTLSSWVSDVVSDVRPEWKSAAGMNLSSKASDQASASTKVAVADNGPPPNLSRNAFGFGFAYEEHPADSTIQLQGLNQDGEKSAMVPAAGRRQTSQHTLAGQLNSPVDTWRRKIGGLWKWSEAVPLLLHYYSSCGTGPVSSSTDFVWKGGKLHQDKSARKEWGTELSVFNNERLQLRRCLDRHLQGLAAPHIFLHGPPGHGKTWLLAGELARASKVQGLVVVRVTLPDVKTLPQLLEEVAKHWQRRFALLMDDLVFKAGDEAALVLKSSLDGSYRVWPKNALLCVTSPSKDLRPATVPGKGAAPDPVAAAIADRLRLTLRVSTDVHPDEDEYGLCFKELLTASTGQAELDDEALAFLTKTEDGMEKSVGQLAALVDDLLVEGYPLEGAKMA
eukprot:SM000114S24149  [mRNA]  locus=s114:229543:234032:- [translate_table: standard]